MSINLTELFETLCNNFFEVNQDIDAIIVSDVDGLIIFGEKREEVDLEIVSVLTSIVHPVLERIRDEFAFQQFGTASFDTEIHRLLFISIDEKITLSLVIDTMASIDKVSPYAYFLAEKTARILNAEEDDVIQLDIPNFEYEAEKAKRLKNQIYQLRLDTGRKFRFKFIIIGDHEVGKTSIVRRFVENKFTHDYRATIGLNILTHSINFLDNDVKLSIWDIGAQKYFRRFRNTYYIGAQATFIVFDLTVRQSFENVITWFQEIDKFLNTEDLPIIIVGNKSDLKDERVVDYQEGVELTNSLSERGIKNISYIETSALTGENINDAFRLISYHYIMKSKEIEENKLKADVLEEINSIIPLKENLTITFLTESKYWSPALQILNSILSEFELANKIEEKNRHIYEYKNGICLRNYSYDSMEIKNSDGIFCIFDARNRDSIKPEWRDIIIEIIKTIDEKKVVLVGIRVSENVDWSKIMEEFNINEYLEKKMISFLFFRIGEEYRLEIFDQLKVMFSTIESVFLI
ncbi:MAG: GTP-binding protein [Promethearchaeati archaeon]